MPLEYEGTEKLRESLESVEFGKLGLQIHFRSFISIAVTTMMKRATAKKDRIIVHTPPKST